METTNEQIEYVKKHPMMVGVLAVLATLSLGLALSFAAGFTHPAAVSAQVGGGPPCAACGGVGGGGGGGVIIGGGTTVVPSSCELRADGKEDEETVAAGSAVTLEWSTVGAVSASIDNGIGNVSVDGGTRTVTVNSDTAFHMTVAGGTTLIPCDVTVHVTQPPPTPPSCTYLKASATSLPAGGGQVTLSWAASSNTTGFTIQGIGAVTPPTGGTKTVTVTKDTTFTGVATGAGGTSSAPCTAVVTVASPPSPPTCTLNISVSSITSGGSALLTWSSTGAQSVSLQNTTTGEYLPGVFATGQATVTPTQTTTYLFTATSASGTSVTCSKPITVKPPQAGAPACTFLHASPTSLPAGGGTVTLTWAATNVSAFTIDGVNESPASGNTTTVTVTADHTFTGIASGPGGPDAVCTAHVTVASPAPSCALLTASPTSFVDSGTPTLAWQTANASSFTIDQGIGSVTPVAVGSTSAKTAITTTTTYTGTAHGAGGPDAVCTATVTVTHGGGGDTPACTLTADDSQVTKGSTTTLHWTSHDATSFTIDDGIGSVTPVSAGATTTPAINDDITFTGTASGPDGTKTCSVTVTVPTEGCTSGCGGGGHHSSHHPNVVVSSLEQPGNQPLSYVYLSEIPYTGLDLGPVGTFLYWLMLAAWSAALAYLVLFKALPFITRRARRFGGSVSDALNREPALAYQSASAAHAPEAPRAHSPGHRAAHASVSAANVADRGYSTYDGFRSFAQGGALSIDDIVKGLSRMPAPVSHTEAERTAMERTHTEPVYDHVEPVYQHVETIAASPRVPQAQAHAPLPHVPAFLESLVNAERDAVYATLRDMARMGDDTEAFLAQVAVALDDAFRARIEGAPVHAEVKRITDPVATPVLEKLATSLASAIDSSYSHGITGANLAVTRALNVVGA